MTTNNESSATCAACGGRCCKTCPGMFAPEDLGAPDVERMRAEIRSALDAGAQVDWWEGDPRNGKDELERCYFVRAPIAIDGAVYSPTFGGTCGWLTPTGCSRAFDNRPTACRELLPRKEERGSCETPSAYSKRRMSAAWASYQRVIQDVADGHPRCSHKGADIDDPEPESGWLLRRMFV